VSEFIGEEVLDLEREEEKFNKLHMGKIGRK
jgi:hypothetical protein